jgi:CDGSH-type Zn-finger protein
MALTIKGRENGPYMIDGAYTYTDADGNEQTTTGSREQLCRRGSSSNQPFCDGTHRKIDFRAPAVKLTLVSE